MLTYRVGCMARINVQVARTTKAWDQLSMKYKRNQLRSCLSLCWSLLALSSMNRPMAITWATKCKIIQKKFFIYICPTRYLLFGISDTLLLLTRPPITTGSYIIILCIPKIPLKLSMVSVELKINLMVTATVCIGLRPLCQHNFWHNR